MIEKTIYDHLKASGLAVYMEIPQGGGTPPFVVVERTGGGEENHIKRCTVAIQSYGATLYKAAELNETVKQAMEGLIQKMSVASCRLNSDYNFTDTTKKLYRYQAVFDIVHY